MAEAFEQAPVALAGVITDPLCVEARDTGNPLPIFEKIAQRLEAVQRRAFELYEKRGRELGHDVEDWLKAERELLGWPAIELAEPVQLEMERRSPSREPNGWVPRDFWLEDWKKQAIIGFHLKNPLEGCRRLTFMMLDADIVSV